ncbi:MAG: site-2 protease family protein [Minisyncoccia bacterium]
MIIFRLIVFLYSVILHEIAHGYVAYKLGDDTALKMGRLTLNPLYHLDLFGSIFVPLIFYFISGGSLIFGWAKPVPYNPFKLKNLKRDTALLGLAGPAANFLLAFLFGCLIRLSIFLGLNSLVSWYQIIVAVNLILAVFNLIPIPPFDGSKILFYLLPSERLEIFLSQYRFIFLFLILMWGWVLIFPIVEILFSLFTGLSF